MAGAVKCPPLLEGQSLPRRSGGAERRACRAEAPKGRRRSLPRRSPGGAKAGNLGRVGGYSSSSAVVTDEALMRAVRDGDVARLGVLFERHHRSVFDFLVRMTGDRAASEDMVQDVFVRMLKYRATYRDDGSFETWMFRIARNARADYFRTRHAAAEVSDEGVDVQSGSPGPATLLEKGQEIDQLRRALRLIREDRRELIVLARYRGMKYEQIADLLDVDVGTVKVRMHRAVKELRDTFLRLASDRYPCDVKTSLHTLPTI
jgi:RNA polymerase sigma factor (sigma-70 family)